MLTACGKKHLVIHKVPPRFLEVDQRPFAEFPKLPEVQEDGTRDPCDMHRYRVAVEVYACTEAHERRIMQERISRGKDTYQVPEECVSILRGYNAGSMNICYEVKSGRVLTTKSNSDSQ